MKKQSNYRVVTGTKAEEVAFQSLVNSMLSEGYLLAGGIVVSNGGGLTQTVYKETETYPASEKYTEPKQVEKVAVSDSAPRKGRPKKVVE